MSERGTPDEKRGPVEEGTVIESMPNDMYRIELESGQKVIAHIAQSMRMNFTRIRPGERVSVEISTYDHRRGRITKRLV